MKIAVAGTGYAGLATGVCLAEHKHEVTCVDVDEKAGAIRRENKYNKLTEEALCLQ